MARAHGSRWSERLARSSRVFLVGLVVACGVEVVVDWNQTFTEINQLRDQIRQKGVHYAGLVQRASAGEVIARDAGGIARLGDAILDDEDAAYVRVTDAAGAVVFDRTKPGYDAFRARYAHAIARDVMGVLDDPEAFRARVAASRYRDTPQIWAETVAGLTARLTGAQPTTQRSGVLVYQDRLRDESRRRDDRATWMVGTIEDAGRNVGAVLVVFDMARTNKAVRGKYYKGFGIVFFFVALILVQNVIARRDKLRLLDLESRYASAKAALRAALPAAPIKTAALTFDAALEQAQGPVDGMVYDARAMDAKLRVLVVDPDGDGIDAAAIALHMLKTFRARRSEGVEATLDEELAALGAATEHIPLTRPISAIVLDVADDGAFEAVHGDLASLHVLDGGATAIEARQLAEGAPAGVVGPLFRSAGSLPAGATLLVACGATDSGPVAQAAAPGKKAARIDAASLVRFAERARGGFNASDAATWTRGKSGGLSGEDIVIACVTRKA